jgi:hypothetical protein
VGGDGGRDGWRDGGVVPLLFYWARWTDDILSSMIDI